MRQQNDEPLADYCKRFISCINVEESQCGTLVPTAAATNETNEKMSRDKFITCVFLSGGVDAKNYGRLKTELNNAYVAGQNNYPKMVESAVTTMLSHHMNDKGVQVTVEDKRLATLTSLMQKYKNMTYYRCGKKGHYANKEVSRWRQRLQSEKHDPPTVRVCWTNMRTQVKITRAENPDAFI
jgi:hypothetical protein